MALTDKGSQRVRIETITTLLTKDGKSPGTITRVAPGTPFKSVSEQQYWITYGAEAWEKKYPEEPKEEPKKVGKVVYSKRESAERELIRIRERGGDGRVVGGSQSGWSVRVTKQPITSVIYTDPITGKPLPPTPTKTTQTTTTPVKKTGWASLDTPSKRQQKIMEERLKIHKSGTLTAEEKKYIQTGDPSDFMAAAKTVGYASITITELPKYGDTPSKGIEPTPKKQPWYAPLVKAIPSPSMIPGITGPPMAVTSPVTPKKESVKKPKPPVTEEPITLLDKYIPSTVDATLVSPATQAWYKTAEGTKFVQEKVTWDYIEPSVTKPYRHLLKHQEAEEEILKKRYEKLYEQSIISGKTGELQDFWDKLYQDMPEKEQETWLRRYTNIGVIEEERRKKEEEEEKLEWWQKLGAYMAMPFGQRVEYAKASLLEYRFKPGSFEPVKGGTVFESPSMIKVRESTEQEYLRKYKLGDIKGITFDVLSSPLPTAMISYGAGVGLGALKISAWGAKPFLVSKVVAKTGKPVWTLTRAGAIEKTAGAYLFAETAKGGVEAYKEGRLSDYISMAAVTAPFVILPFHYGTRTGMGYMQKTHAMSKLTDPLQRVQQKALMDGMKISRTKLREPVYDVRPYDITRVDKVGIKEAGKIPEILGKPGAKYIQKAHIGGSAAMDIQYPSGFFRAGGYPKRLLDIASIRQQWAFKRGLQRGPSVKPLKLTGRPGDIDILLRGMFASEQSKVAQALRSTGSHVHKGRIGSYYGFGETTFPSVKGRIFRGKLEIPKAIDVKLLSKREQFMRTSISLLPSEQPITGYRAFKDIPTWYDTGQSLIWQKQGMKLQSAMDRFMYPEKHLKRVPRVTFGEKLVKKIGGTVEPQYVEMPGDYLQAFYPKHVYPKTYTPISLAGMYPGYKTKIGKYITPTKITKKPYTPSYKTPTYKLKTPKIKIPDVVKPYKSKKPEKTIPSLIPPYTPPKTPPYKPIPSPFVPTKTPPYKPPKTPPYTPPTPPPYEPPYTPPKPPPYKPIYEPPPPPLPIGIPFEEWLPEKHKTKIKKVRGTKKYKYRQFKIKNILKDWGIKL